MKKLAMFFALVMISTAAFAQGEGATAPAAAPAVEKAPAAAPAAKKEGGKKHGKKHNSKKGEAGKM